MASDLDRKAHELSAAWDRLLAGEPVNGADIDPGMIETVDRLIALQTRELVSDEIEGSIWAKVIAGTSEQWRPITQPDPVAITAPNGLAARTRSTAMSAFVVRFGWVIAAGFVGGFLAGISSRLAMRVAGILTIDRNRYRLTENGNRVGEITFDGTLFLGLVAGSAGIVTMLLYLLLRNRLPFDGWQRSAVFSVLLLAVFGFVLMDPTNHDYQTFGPAWLNVAMFSSLYLIMGFLTSQIYEAGTRRDLVARVLAARKPVRFPIVGVSTVTVGFGLLVMGGVFFLGAAALFVLVIVGLVAWMANRVVFRRGRDWNLYLPRVVQPLGLLVVPGIIGFILTARGITEILMNR